MFQPLLCFNPKKSTPIFLSVAVAIISVNRRQSSSQSSISVVVAIISVDRRRVSQTIVSVTSQTCNLSAYNCKRACRHSSSLAVVPHTHMRIVTHPTVVSLTRACRHSSSLAVVLHTRSHRQCEHQRFQSVLRILSHFPKTNADSTEELITRMRILILLYVR